MSYTLLGKGRSRIEIYNIGDSPGAPIVNVLLPLAQVFGKAEDWQPDTITRIFTNMDRDNPVKTKKKKTFGFWGSCMLDWSEITLFYAGLSDLLNVVNTENGRKLILTPFDDYTGEDRSFESIITPESIRLIRMAAKEPWGFRGLRINFEYVKQLQRIPERRMIVVEPGVLVPVVISNYGIIDIPV